MAVKPYPALYEELGVNFSSKSGENWTAVCPLHDDSVASLSIQVETGEFKCFVPTCKGFKGGPFERFYQLRTGKNLPIPLDEVEELHQKLLKNAPAMKWLNEMRGISRATVAMYKLGFDGERLTIPIFESGDCVNIRRHSVKKNTTAPKTISYKPGYGSLKLFPEEHLKEDFLVLCEGELDAILMSQLGYSAITVTGGAASWKDDWTPLFKNKTVYVVYDIDKAGREGARAICKKLHGTALILKDILLPISSPPNGDVTDYVVVHGAGKPEFDHLFKDAGLWEETKKTKEEITGDAVEVELADASQSKWVGRNVKFKATVAGKDLSPYACPSEVNLTCQMGLRICSFCSIGQNNGTLKYQVQPSGLEVLRLINCSEEQQRGFLRKAAGVYPGCPRFNMKVDTYHTVEDVRLIPEISFNSMATAEYVVRQAYHVGHGLVPNNVYQMEGAVVPNPKNQYITFVLPKAKPVKDSITGFKLTDEMKEQLKVFQAEEGKCQEKFAEIAKDLTANVTKIYQRDALVTMLDLVYHSVLQFDFQGRLVKKGWTEALALGDTRCGKTETVTSLIEHYRAGELSTGENASFAGLIGGMQQIGSRWSIIWGKFPLNDRRLLVIDEVSGMPVEDIGKMSGVRSSGIAEIIKVQQEKTFARTRLIWLGNPRSSRPLATYDSGVQAIRELIGRPEDIARFDLAMTVASGEVPIEIINKAQHEKVSHVFTSDLCHNLVLWAWSRKPADVSFTPEASRACLEGASQLSKEFSAAIPLVEPAEQRIKLARLSVAAAARVFSTTTGEDVIVRAEHVEFVCSFMRKIFNSSSMNYGAFSKAQMADLKLKNEEEVLVQLQPYGKDLVEALLERQYIRMVDLEDVLNLGKAEVKPIIARLVQNRALKHYHTSYVKSPAFIEFLRRLLAQGMGVPVVRKEEF